MTSPQKLLDAVQRSPDAVALHDRTAWVRLYATDGLVNDPVGSRPHRGREAIERFYDTFIAPNTIVFHVENDVTAGMTVFRDLSLETIMSSGAVLHVPMHLRYDLVDEGGELKIQRLHAHWELQAMIGQLLRAGPKGLIASARLTPQLVSNQGIGGVVGFMEGLRGVGKTGKAAAKTALSEIAAGPGNHHGMTFEKFIAAGRSVTASIAVGDARGVALVEFAPHDLAITHLELFL